LTIFLKIFKINSVPFLKEDLFSSFFNYLPKKYFSKRKELTPLSKAEFLCQSFSKKELKIRLN